MQTETIIQLAVSAFVAALFLILRAFVKTRGCERPAGRYSIKLKFWLEAALVCLGTAVIVNTAAASAARALIDFKPGILTWTAAGLLVLSAVLGVACGYMVSSRRKNGKPEHVEDKLQEGTENRKKKKTKTSSCGSAGILLRVILLSLFGGCVLFLMDLKGMNFSEVVRIFSAKMTAGGISVAWTAIVIGIFVCLTPALALLLRHRYASGKRGACASYFGAHYIAEQAPDTPKKIKRKLRLMTMIIVISAWYFTGVLLNWLSGGKGGGLQVEFEMFSERTTLFGLSIANTTILTWVVIGVVLLFALIFRFLVFPRFRERPQGLQNVMELAVEAMDSFAKNTVGEYGASLSPYMFSIAVLMVGCAATELFGQRPPTSDLLMTGTMGLVTFALINYYGFRKKGIGGRIRGMAKPSPVIFPMKVLSDVAVPVSLACRLFGNMLGGMIVMDLLKSSLGGYSVGITALAGIYFNLFHPLIQTYIFIILSMTFINEATE